MFNAASLRLTSLAFVVALSSLAGCGPDDPAESSIVSGPCAALLPECQSNQKICVDSAMGPACEACGSGMYADRDTNTCQPIDGTPLSHDFAEFTVKPGEEVLGLCQSWTLNNPEELWVNGVELDQDEASHHSNWMHVPSDKFDGPDGVWPCKDRNYSQFTAALYGGVLYAQSTQASHEVQKFPKNVASRIPPYSRVIGDIHLLNVTSSDITGHAKMSIYSIPKEEVHVKLAPFHMTYEELAIPPHQTSRFTGDCDVGQYFPSQKLKMKVYYVLPHTHALGTRLFFNASDGSSPATPIIDVRGFNGEARGVYYDPPIDITGKNLLSFGCEFTNPRDETVHWGFGDQEMCEFLGFAEATTAFETRVSVVDPAGSDGSTPLFTGPCDTVAFYWDNAKPGGPGPSN